MKDKLVFTHKNFKKYKSMNNTVECLIKERKVREYIFGDVNKKGKRRRWQQRTRWLNGITYSMEMSLSKLQEMVKDREAWQACSPWGHTESDTTEQLNNKIKNPCEHLKTEKTKKSMY